MQSYDEIIDLAEKGNRFNVDTSNKAFKREMEPPSEDDGAGEECCCSIRISIFKLNLGNIVV